ncbi:MAG: FtsQ-type POTRA domain-containing protein [Clostridia bacterium]|nr:FtsQ-type POTRA domain-containing protein [Clostridia bacterium]
MKKNAKIAVAVGVLAVITLIIVLSSTIFAVGSARIIWYNTPTSSLASLTNSAVLSSSGVERKSVFMLDKDFAKRNLEKKYPRLRVVDLEVVFPNSLNIHVIERQDVYAVALPNGTYAITDEYLRVLDVVSTYSSTNVNPVVLKIKDLEGSFKKGDDISSEYPHVFIDLYNAFVALGQSVTNFRALATNIEYTNAKLTISTHFGVTIILDNPTQNSESKMRMAIKTFELLSTEDYGKGTIEVFVNSQNKIESRYY